MDETLTPREFADRLRDCYAAADERLRREFQRSLPFGDALFDRWERARSLGFGEGASIYNSAAVFGDVRVGAQTWIGPWTLLDGSGGALEIGAFCSIAAGVHVYTHDTVMWALSGGQLPRETRGVRIGDCVYIGPHSIVAAGVTIGTRSLVAANSFVNADIPDGTIVGGSPARRLGAVVGEGADIRLMFDSRG